MIKFTAHARERLSERGLAAEWVVRTINLPDFTDKDPQNGSVTRSVLLIPEAAGRRLKVVHRADDTDTLVITAFFDVGF